MSNISANLAALVGSRLCHDLISPIGAIQNGLELMALTGGGKDSPELTLIQDSCASATARIRFFRVAFGFASENQIMSPRETAATLDAVSTGGRLKTSWTDTEDQPRTDIQLCFLAYLCCESALPMGGTVGFERDAAGWTIRASGPRVNADPLWWDHVNGIEKVEEPPADKVHFALLPILARDHGKQLFASTSDSGASIKIS